MIRLLVLIGLACALTYCCATVPLGSKTFFGHIRSIWRTEEVRELKDGVKGKAGPTANRVKRGVEAGYEAMKDEGSAGSGSGSGSAVRKKR